MDKLLQRFLQYIRAENLFAPGDHLVIAVSGGVDSVMLCELCHRAGFSFSIAHANFQLRGEDSTADEAFVQALAERLQVRFHVRRFDTLSYAKEKGIGIQEAARELRYAWFAECREQELSELTVTDKRNNAPVTLQKVLVLTAHHADDQVETLLMNFFKGTGIRGLQAISPASAPGYPLARPLLFCRKDELLRLAKENNISFREDASNANTDYTRNAVRHQIIPAIKAVFPQVEENMLDNIQRFRDISDLYHTALQKIKDSLMEKDRETIRIPVLKLAKIPSRRTILFEILREFGFTTAQTDEALRLLHSETGKFVSSGTHRIFRNRNWLVISAPDSNEQSQLLIADDDKKVSFSEGVIELTELSAQSGWDNNPLHACLDAREIVYPLLLRKWKAGDYFYPLGMDKKKKISRFLVDQKLSLAEKEKVWVMESGKRIVWVVGMRLDNRFRLRPSSERMLRIHFQPKP
ncbi:MAG TPA: tRNA lysidine(34) synthetase TilS [Ferruginibacter sp.]|nr:tRNA lysidine(34) synthetase TilS [Ferruginibacter sp.]